MDAQKSIQWKYCCVSDFATVFILSLHRSKHLQFVFYKYNTDLRYESFELFIRPQY